MAIAKEALDELLKDYKGPEGITEPKGLLKQLSKAVIERAMQAEMTEQLGYGKSDQSKKETENRHNGKTTKALRTDQGPPEIVPKHQRDFKGFDNKILTMYSRGMTTRDITETLKEIYLPFVV